MKNIKNALAFAAILVVFSCNKSESVDISLSTENYLTQNSIGFWHNEVLKVFHPEGRQIVKNSVIDYKKLRQEVMVVLNQKDPSQFNLEEMVLSAKESDLRIAEMQLSLDKPIEFVSQSFKVVEYLKVKGHISGKLYSKLLDVYSSQTTNEALSKVNLLYSSKWTASDKQYAETFANVYKASHDFWTKRQTRELSLRSANDCNNAIIIADAAGALYGLLCGPACSIIEGALFSLAAANGPACSNQ